MKISPHPSGHYAIIDGEPPMPYVATLRELIELRQRLDDALAEMQRSLERARQVTPESQPANDTDHPSP